MANAIEMSYNSPAGLPPNFQEVTEQEFVNRAMRRSYTPVRMEYRPVPLMRTAYGSTKEVREGLTLFWYQGGKGDAILLDWFEKRCRYFLFAECIHENEGVKLGNCWYRYTCKKCGYVEEVDSSG